jgi:urease accessory protein
MTQRWKACSRVGIAGVALAVWLRPAEAHLVETGLGPIYDGVAHLALSPEDFVPIVGAALLEGLRGKAHARIAILLVPIAWFVGGALGGFPGAPILVAPSWAPFMIIGGLVAADLYLPIGVAATLFGSLGFVLGYPNGIAMAQYGQGLRGVFGSTVVIFVLVTLVAALAARWGSGWIRIAWRVAGSWIAASGLLLLGWALR